MEEDRGEQGRGAGEEGARGAGAIAREGRRHRRGRRSRRRIRGDEEVGADHVVVRAPGLVVVVHHAVAQGDVPFGRHEVGHGLLRQNSRVRVGREFDAVRV